MCCKRIGERRFNEAVFEAKIHGAELKEDAKKEELAPEKERQLDIASIQALDGLRKRREAIK